MLEAMVAIKIQNLKVKIKKPPQMANPPVGK